MMKMISTDIQLFNQFTNERKLSQRTIYGYSDSLNKFISFTNDSLTNRLNLYEKQEENTPWRHRQIKKDLIGFQNFLLENLLYNTAKAHFTRICTFLRHYDFELHNLPKMNAKNCKKPKPIYHNDLLKKEEIRTILENCDHDGLKSLILFCCVSGCARKEALSLTIEDYLRANNTYFYPKMEDDEEYDVKNFIKNVNSDFVPIFKILRHKTNKHYFTFCTPQSNKMIKNYLLNRNRGNMDLNSPLFKINLDYLNRLMHKLNDDLNLGTAGQYIRLRTHMLRKYNASVLYNDGMSIEDVDAIQGRGKDNTHSAYFMEDPLKLRDKYVEHLEVLII